MTKIIEAARASLGYGRLAGWAAMAVVAYLLSSAAVSGKLAQNSGDSKPKILDRQTSTAEK